MVLRAHCLGTITHGTTATSAPEAGRVMQPPRPRPLQVDLRRSAVSTAAGGPPLTPRRDALPASTSEALQVADVDAVPSAAADIMPALVWLATGQPYDRAAASKQATPADGHCTAHPSLRDGHALSRPLRAFSAVLASSNAPPAHSRQHVHFSAPSRHAGMGAAHSCESEVCGTVSC